MAGRSTITLPTMRTAGIIGGIGPESTIVYYRSFIRLYRERSGDDSYPSLIINSINLARIVAMFTANELPQVADYLVSELQRLADAGADCGIIAANTPHIVFNEVRSRSPIPLISIVEATCAEAQSRGWKKLGLFGTRFTMQANFYPEVFTPAGIALAIPNEKEQAYIHGKYMNELIHGILLPETEHGLLEIADRLRQQEEIEGLILGGTELPLIMRDGAGSIPFLDTMEIHVRALIDELER
jgi:aspartate racemase